MRPCRWAAAILVIATVVATAPVHAQGQQPHAATIASFKYIPADVRIAVGESVEWTNLDSTVHTVTASRGEFSSASMHQGQTFTAQFNVPGVYPYFCEPHEFMTATVSVTGPAPPTTAPPPTTTTVTAPASGVTTSSVVAPAATTTTVAAPTDAPPTPPVDTTGAVVAVTSGPVEGGTARTSPTTTAAVVVVLAAIGFGVLLRLGVTRADALRFVAVGATLVTALVHLQLRFVLDYPEPIGTLLVIEAAAATVLAAWVVARPWSRLVQVVALGGHVAALGALAVTRTSVGLFGFHERGWDPSPQLPIALTVGVLAIALLAATPVAADTADSVG